MPHKFHIYLIFLFQLSKKEQSSEPTIRVEKASAFSAFSSSVSSSKSSSSGSLSSSGLGLAAAAASPRTAESGFSPRIQEQPKATAVETGTVEILVPDWSGVVHKFYDFKQFYSSIK